MIDCQPNKHNLSFRLDSLETKIHHALISSTPNSIVARSHSYLIAFFLFFSVSWSNFLFRRSEQQQIKLVWPYQHEISHTQVQRLTVVQTSYGQSQCQYYRNIITRGTTYIPCTTRIIH